MEAYSKEFRRDVLRACDAGGGTREVALKFDVSESWVSGSNRSVASRASWLPRPRAIGGRSGSRMPTGSWLELDRRPDMYLCELQAAALEELSWQVSDVTLSRACRALRRTRKKRL